MIKNLKIYQKWEDMAVYGYCALQQYPKSEKFSLAKDTRDVTWNIGSLIVRANTLRNVNARKQCIDEIDYQIVRLKILVRMGMKLQFLPMRKYENWINYLVELGKMIGGWLKSITHN